MGGVLTSKSERHPMEFLILVSLILLNVQIYKMSKFFIVVDEQEKDLEAFGKESSPNGKY